MSANPPAITASEASLVGALIFHPDTVENLPAGLRGADFECREMGRCFDAILELHQGGQPVDGATVAARLAGDLAAVDALEDAQETPGSHPRHYAEAILAAGVTRQLAAKLSAIGHQARAGAADPSELLAATEAARADAEARLVGSEKSAGTTAAEGMAEVWRQIEAARNGELAGIPTGLSSLDRSTGGLRPGETWIVGARPSAGKSLLGAQFAASAADHGRAAVLVSFEMPGDQYWFRVLADVCGIDLIRLRGAELDREEWMRLPRAMSEVAERFGDNFTILDRLSIKVDAVVSELRRRHRRGELDLVVIDYVQRMTAGREAPQSGNRNAELEIVSRRLADFAREARIPVVVLSQLRRNDTSEPTLSDLRDCGSLEADADVVILLHRPDAEDEHLRRAIIAKARNGATGSLALRLDPQRMRLFPSTPALPR